MDIELDHPVDPSGEMDYDEEPLPEVDEVIDGVPRDDEVMATDAIQVTSDINPIPIEEDLDGAENIGDGMEPEPTPTLASDTAGMADPFFVPASVAVGVDVSAPIVPSDGAQEMRDLAGHDTRLDAGGEASADGADGVEHPFIAEDGQDQGGGSGAVVDAGKSAPDSSIHIDHTLDKAHPDIDSGPQADITEAQAQNEGDEQYTDEDGEEYYEDDEEPQNAAEQVQLIGTEADLGQAGALGDTEGEEEDLAEEDEDDDDGGDSEMLTVNTLPGVVLHLPHQPPRALFFPLDPQDGLPDGISAATPVWFADRHAELAQVPLSKLLQEVRALIEAEKAYEAHEMVIVDKSLGLKLCEDDKYLAQVTLLEYLQVHHSCALPTPAQLFVTFTPNRFWSRFDAIRKELVHAAERRKLGVEDEGDEEEFDEEEDDGYVSEVEGGSSGHAQQEEVRGTRHRGEDARAQYAGSEDAEAKPARQIREEVAHPNADWAKTLPTAPMAYGIGSTASPNVRSRETSRPAETPHNDARDPSPPANKGRSSRQDAAADTADTTEASTTDSRSPNMRNVPLDEVALKMGAPKGADQVDKEADEGFDGEDEEGDEGEEGLNGVEATKLGANVPRDEIAMLEQSRAVEAPGIQTSNSTFIDEGIDLTADEKAYDGKMAAIASKASTLEATARTVPLGDVELAALDGEVPLSVNSSFDGSIAPSGFQTPPLSSDLGNKPLIGSSLAKEVKPDESADTAFSTIPEENGGENKEEYVEEVYYDDAAGTGEDEEEEEEYEETDFDRLVANEEAKGAKDVVAIGQKNALAQAVADGLVLKEVAVDVVGGKENYEAGYTGDEALIHSADANDTDYDNEEEDFDDEAVNPYAGGDSAATSTTVEDDDEGYDDPEKADSPRITRSAKRPADDDSEVLSTGSKRLK